MPFKSKTRPDVWQGQVKWEGRIHRASYPTRKEAVEWERKKKEALEEATRNPDLTALDLVSFAEQYLDHAELQFTQKVFKEKKALTHKLLEATGNMLVSEVTPDLIRRYLHARAKNTSANASNKDRKNLLAMWNWGQDMLDLPVNPVAKTKKIPHDRSPQYTPPTADVLKVLAACTPEDRVFLQCYLNTGARRAEIFRWTWLDDINFDRREVRLGTRKNRDGSMKYEWLPMNPDLYEELWWWWNHRPIKDSLYVFVSTSKKPGRHYGKPYKERRWFMETLCKKAGVKPFGFHALRRYVASYLADTCKVGAKTIQRILRHQNLHTTELYIQNLNNDLASTMDLLGGSGYREGYQSTADE